MNEWKKPAKEDREIDLWRFVEVLLKRFWIIVLAAAIFAVCGYSYTKLFIPKQYRTRFQVYITNSNSYDDKLLEQDKTNTGDLNASIGLTYPYEVIIKSDTVLNRAATSAGLDHKYNAAKLKGMVSTSLYEKTSMIQVTVVANDPDDAQALAQAIAKCTEDRGEQLKLNSSFVLLDEPNKPTSPFAPNATGNGVLVGIVGALLTYALFVVIDLVNDRVKNSEDLESRYNLVVVGRIPDMSRNSREYRYRYKYSYRRYNYGKGYGESK